MLGGGCCFSGSLFLPVSSLHVKARRCDCVKTSNTHIFQHQLAPFSSLNPQQRSPNHWQRRRCHAALLPSRAWVQLVVSRTTVPLLTDLKLVFPASRRGGGKRKQMQAALRKSNFFQHLVSLSRMSHLSSRARRPLCLFKKKKHVCFSFLLAFFFSCCCKFTFVFTVFHVSLC